MKLKRNEKLKRKKSLKDIKEIRKIFFLKSYARSHGLFLGLFFQKSTILGCMAIESFQFYFIFFIVPPIVIEILQF